MDDALASYLGRREHTRDRDLLSALAYARGHGFSDDQWLTVTEVIFGPATRQDLRVLRDSPAADYLLTTEESMGGRLVTRLFHQALVDELVRANKDDDAGSTKAYCSVACAPRLASTRGTTTIYNNTPPSMLPPPNDLTTSSPIRATFSRLNRPASSPTFSWREMSQRRSQQRCIGRPPIPWVTMTARLEPRSYSVTRTI